MACSSRYLVIALLGAALCTPAACSLYRDDKGNTCRSGIRCPPGAQCTADGSACITDDCGNGIIDPGEACDDGNSRDDDICCGCVYDGCGRCGDGVLDPGEACDDNNNASCDGCRADCWSNETCGNGAIDCGEECDDGNQISGDDCSSACRLEGCGNGLLDPGEACDDGNTLSCDGCTADCLAGEACGNGVVDCGEECDGGPLPTENCDFDCTLPVCGDGATNTLAREACDDGGVDTDFCDADCTIPACGDAHCNPAAGECDAATLCTVDCPSC
jgi:cysteine-rich repeat protein